MSNDERNSRKRYMPLRTSPDQTLTGSLPSDGECLIFELSASVFVPGAKCWSEVLEVEEHSRFMQLFLFVLDRCIDVSARVVLETLVSQNDYIDVHNSTISDTIDWRGFRLWIPMSPYLTDAFIGSLETALADNSAHEMMFTPGGPTSSANAARRENKRRKIIQQNLSLHMRPVKSAHHLSQLIRLYTTGRGHAAPSLFTDGDDGTDTAVATDDGSGNVDISLDTNPLDCLSLIDALEHRRYFTSSGFKDYAKEHRLYTPQTSAFNYFKTGADGTVTFSPAASIRPLMRAFKCGSGGFLRESSKELMKYLLPHIEPSDDEIISKLERVLAAKGRHADLRGMSRDDLIATATSTRTDIFDDPHAYSPITVSDDDLADASRQKTIFRSLISKTYHIVTTLEAKNRKTLDHFSVSDNWKDTELVVARIVYDMDSMLSTVHVPGVPYVYNDLWRESAKLEGIMRGLPECKLDETQILARRMYEATTADLKDFTPMSFLINRLVIGTSYCLRLMDAQSTAFVPFYISSFGATYYDKQLSQLFLMTGPPGTGKSTVIKCVADSVAQSLVVKRDSTSALSDTALNSHDDLRLLITDEYKHTVGQGQNEGSTKNEQTRICDGYIVHQRLEHDPNTGKWAAHKYVSICRRCELASTNKPTDIAEAIISRACVIPMTLLDVSSEESHAMTPNLSIATVDNPTARKRSEAWKLYLRYMSALQVRITALDAFGGLPPLDEHCFEMFWCVLEVMLGKKTMPSRRTGDLKELARNIHTMNVLHTWHSGGLGKKFEYNKVIECLWYAHSRYLRMEDIAVAYVLLEQSRSLAVYIELVMKTFKDNIYIADDVMVQTDDYWVLRIPRMALLMRIITAANPEFGTGLCEKLYVLIEQTTFNGQPCVKWEAFIDPHTGQNTEFFMVHKAWIATVNGTAETAIISLLERLSTEGDNIRVFNDYATEEDRVFQTSVRKTLTNPDMQDSIKYDEFKHFSSAQIKHAFCMLCERVDPITLVPLISKPAEMRAAIYRPKEGTIGVVPSVLVTPIPKFKISTDCPVPLVVNPRLWTDLNVSKSKNRDVVSQFLQTVFAIAGGYRGKFITSGVSTNPVDTFSDNHFRVDPEMTCKITIRNPHYCPAHAPSAIFGDAALAAGSEKVISEDTLFPSHQKEILLTEQSYFEMQVARVAQRRVAIAPHIRAVFNTAHGTEAPPS